MPRKENGPRRLVFRHARRCRRALAGIEKELKPGEERLHAFLMPGLTGGKHSVDVIQEVQGKPLTASQQFYVDAPEFKLPEGEVHSVYPPSGHDERAECLPHVVLSTPTLPWEWPASSVTEPSDYKENRNRVPWLAVFVFTKEELQLSSEDLQGDRSLFRNTSVAKSATQTPTLAVGLQVADVSKLEQTVSPIQPSRLEKENDATEVIFVPTSLFKALFTTDDEQGQSLPTTKPNVRPYRFLAHRRDINTDGMAVASLMDTEDDQAAFGVVLSGRTGPVDITEPTACIAHLVSIRGIEDMTWPGSDARFVALSSLHSWTYTGLPPDSPSVYHDFLALGKSSAMLQPPTMDADAERLALDISPGIVERVAERLHDGYALARYRTGTGESTACFFRGPFIPVQIPFSSKPLWHSLSTSGQDLQVLDQRLGLMDITYSAAWQLGRALAIADQEFITRIGHVRKLIYDRGMELAQLQALKHHGVRSRSRLLAELHGLVADLHRLPQISRPLNIESRLSSSHRWFRSPVNPVDLSYRGLKAAAASNKNGKSIADFLIQAGIEISSAVDPEGGPSNEPYNEFNIPFCPDWMAVLKWVLDRYFMATIPAHYLIPDSSMLPLESVRFFRVDWRWIDALVDGALSLANDRDQQDDLVRDAMWAALKRYFGTAVPGLQGTLPPVPRYGCYVRSTLITKFPDLRVELDPPPEPSSPLILLRHEIVSPDTMLCLFSEEPGSSNFQGLSLIQPPHQQTFMAATELDASKITMIYKKSYTVHMEQPEEPFPLKHWSRSEGTGHVPVYRWDASGVEVRRLLMDNLAQDYLTTVQGEGTSYFDDDTATSALMASQLGSVSYKLTFSLSPGGISVGSLEPQSRLPRQPSMTNSPLPPPPPTRPAYHYRVCPVENPSAKAIPILSVEQDLLFLINLEEFTAYDYRLENLIITIPLGKANLGNLTLMESYTGSGAEMISNLRFNVMVDIETKYNKPVALILRIVPRTRSKDDNTPPYVPVTRCSELSFVLNGVQVNQKPGPTKWTVKESYKTKPVWDPYYPIDPITLRSTENEPSG